MNQSGHIKDQVSDNNGFRQFIINCLGDNDQRKYFSISPFGIDFNAPENTRALTADSRNKDVKYNLGCLNKIKIEDLAKGESAIFSTDETGDELQSQIIMRNTGQLEVITKSDIDITTDESINVAVAGDVNVIVDGDIIASASAIQLNGDADNVTGFTKNKEGFDSLKKSVTDLTTAFNTHLHATAAVGPPVPPTPVPNVIPALPPTASIDASKKDNIKTE